MNIPFTDTTPTHIRGIYGRNYQPQQLPASELSIVLYAFANLQSTGEVYVVQNVQYTVKSMCHVLKERRH